jgi:hypothetical protein
VSRAEQQYMAMTSKYMACYGFFDGQQIRAGLPAASRDVRPVMFCAATFRSAIFPRCRCKQLYRRKPLKRSLQIGNEYGPDADNTSRVRCDHPACIVDAGRNIDLSVFWRRVVRPRIPERSARVRVGRCGIGGIDCSFCAVSDVHNPEAFN